MGARCYRDHGTPAVWSREQEQVIARRLRAATMQGLKRYNAPFEPEFWIRSSPGLGL